MTQTTSRRRRQVVDIRAALIAGLVSGLVFLGIASLVTTNGLGTPISVVRLFASIVLGDSILNPDTTVTPVAIVTALVIHILFSIGFGLLVASIVHRWGFIFGIIVGGILGLALYIINFYSLSLIFPWFFAFRSMLMLIGHVLFGAVTGGLYEFLENERYEEVV
jgi:hypothetical protein